MHVEDFHRSRRMFCVIGGEIIVGPANSPLSHLQWLNTLGLDGKKMICECVRGFADDRGLFFYKGEDFHADGQTEEVFFNHLKEIQTALDLSDDTPVFGGVTKTKNPRYPPKKRYGTIRQVTKKVKN